MEEAHGVSTDGQVGPLVIFVLQGVSPATRQAFHNPPSPLKEKKVVIVLVK